MHVLRYGGEPAQRDTGLRVQVGVARPGDGVDGAQQPPAHRGVQGCPRHGVPARVWGQAPARAAAGLGLGRQQQRQ